MNQGKNYIEVFLSNAPSSHHSDFYSFPFLKHCSNFIFSDVYNWILHFSLFNENKKNRQKIFLSRKYSVCNFHLSFRVAFLFLNSF